MKNLVRLAVVAALVGVTIVIGARSNNDAAAQEPDSRLQIYTFSPIVVQRVLELVNEAGGIALNAYDGEGFNGSEPCFIAVALRTVAGDEAGVDELDPDGNTVPCDGDQIDLGFYTPDDFALLDALDADQVSDGADNYWGGLLLVVNDLDPQGLPVEFEASDGQFWTMDAGVQISQGRHFICNDESHDADCTTTSSDFRDGAVALAFSGPFDSRGDVTVTAKVQGDSDRDATTITLKSVGDPESVVPLLNLDPKLEAGGTGVCKPGGEDFTFQNLLQITTLAGLPDAGLVGIQVLDSDGTSLTGIPVEWESSDEDIVIPGFDSQFSLFNSGLLLGPNLICSGPDMGTATVRARVRHAAGSDSVNEASIRTVPQEETELAFTVIGRPAQMVAYADPPTIDCNGVNTTTVNVQVLDAFSNNGVGGREVRFDLQVLGTANPIVGETNGDGLATSVVTPLAQEGSTGVPVIITGPLDMAATVLVNCQVGAGTGAPGGGTAPPAGGGAGAGGQQPGGSISGPDTGSGGVAGSGALPIWPAVALFVAAMGLAGARFGLRRP